MPIRDSIIQILSSSYISRINFRLDQVRVYPDGFATVVTAIRNGRVSIAEISRLDCILSGGSCPDAIYQSRPLAIGSRLVNNCFVVITPFSTEEVLNQALIVHEAVHILNDYNRLVVSDVNNEAAAYVAQGMYLRLHHVEASSFDFTTPSGLVLMLATSVAQTILEGTSPTSAAVSQLYEAILAHPNYRSRRGVMTNYDGF